MTISTFPFVATGTLTGRTLPDRLAEIKNVREFGAAGDGVTDDLAAIQAAFDWTTSSGRGTLYFPPGTYYVSGPIDISSDFSGLKSVYILGCMGASTIIGNFADYVIKRYILDTASWSGGHIIEKLTIINQHASGGGIRWGESVGAAIRDCDITANFGIDTDNSDRTDAPDAAGAFFGSLEVSIENCHLRAHDALAAGSTGLTRGANGPTTNCSFKDYFTAVRTYGGQGGMSFQGCRFEHNNYGLGNGWGPLQETPNAPTNAVAVSGCHFKNNGVAIHAASGLSRYLGILIEAANGTIPGDPQYGIYIPDGGMGLSTFAGIKITGDFAQAGVHVAGGEGIRSPGLFTGISINNTGAGVNWSSVLTAMTVEWDGCNVAPVWTMAELPAKFYTVTSSSWSSGTGKATLTLVGGGDLQNPALGDVTISGAAPSGYNGTFISVEVVDFRTITFTMADPGSPTGTGGTAFYAAKSIAGAANVYEGDTYNVSDADTATWGAAAAGGGSNHVTVRYSGTSWTVMGK